MTQSDNWSWERDSVADYSYAREYAEESEGSKTKGKQTNPEAVLMIFLVATAFIGLANGFSDSILANYFKEAYDANAAQRGFIEIPRELPGVLSLLFWLGCRRSETFAMRCWRRCSARRGLSCWGFLGRATRSC
jgi:hypothetical protein